jgi:hypothetical protein
MPELFTVLKFNASLKRKVCDASAAILSSSIVQYRASSNSDPSFVGQFAARPSLFARELSAISGISSLASDRSIVRLSACDHPLSTDGAVLCCVASD